MAWIFVKFIGLVKYGRSRIILWLKLFGYLVKNVFGCIII